MINEELITTTACTQIRDRNDYNARLDFTYLYLLEYGTTMNTSTQIASMTSSTVILHSMERAIATSVATTLNRCTTDEQYPLYAVEISSSSSTNGLNPSKHIIIPSSDVNNTKINVGGVNTDSNTKTCPISNNSTSDEGKNDIYVSFNCIMVRGITSILFIYEESDGSVNVENNVSNVSSGSNTIDWTYMDSLISATINNVYYVNQFLLSDTMRITQTQFIRSMGTNVVLLSDHDMNEHGNTSTVQVAIIASVLSFTFTIMFLGLIGLFCRHYLTKRSNTDHSRMINKRRRRQRHDLFSFAPLDDEFLSDSIAPTIIPPGWMVITNNHDQAIEINNVPSQHQHQHRQQSSAVPIVTSTWSDITSDSESIISSLHLDRIEEVDEEMGDQSYEQHYDCDDNGHDTGIDRSNKGLDLNEHVEICLRSPSGSRTDSDIVTFESSIRPSMSSDQHQNKQVNIEVVNHNAIDFVEDWNVSFQTNHSSSTKGQSRDDNQESMALADLSIEISIDDEVMLMSNDAFPAENDFEPYDDRDFTHSYFTFSSDDDSDKVPCKEDEPITNNKQLIVTEVSSGHFYDDDDFHSIEMCVVWLDDKGNEQGQDDESEIVFSPESTKTSVLPTPTTDVLFGCQYIDDRNGDDTLLSSYDSTTVGPPQNINGAATALLISEVTNFNNCRLQESTTSTAYTKDEYSFTSSGAYRSVLDRDTHPTIVVESNSSGTGSTTSNESEISSTKHQIAQWAKDVLLKLMSDSPKMIQCDRTKNFDSFPSNDIESLY
jgi:hypothetical protein